MKSPRLLILDFETTGIDPNKDLPIEVAFIEYQDRKLFSLSSFLIRQPLLESFPKEIEELVGVTHQEHKDSAILDEAQIIGYLNALRFNFDYIVAHFGNQFDKLFFNKMLERNKATNETDQLFSMPWLDSALDIDYPKHITTRKLQYLASEYGYANPYPHRALFDCIALAKILDHQDIGLMIENSKQNYYDVVMDIDKPWLDGGKSKDYAKNNGFKFNGETKQWIRKMRELQYSQAKFDYPVRILEEG